jgi:hypothetical protein
VLATPFVSDSYLIGQYEFGARATETATFTSEPGLAWDDSHIVPEYGCHAITYIS